MKRPLKRWTSRTRDITASDSDSLASISLSSSLATKNLWSTCRIQGVTKVTQKIHVAIISHFYRKASPESELDVLVWRDSGSDASLLQEKQDKASIVELKNGKVVFKQKPISFEKQSDTLQGKSLRYGL